jgi:hypothetical protein
MSDDLISLMDESAKALLRRIVKEDSVSEEGAPLAEQVRAFGAVADWMATRAKVVPPEQAESKISELRRKLDAKPRRGTPANRGTVASAAEAGEA